MTESTIPLIRTQPPPQHKRSKSLTNNRPPCPINFHLCTSLFYHTQNSNMRKVIGVQTLIMEFEVQSTEGLFPFAQ
jgi:hypothetical protein